MSDSQQHGPTGRIEGSEEQGGELTRRTVLVGVAATTVAATVAAASIRNSRETWSCSSCSRPR